MIASKTRGDSFRDLLAYVLHPSHDPSLIVTNMAGRDPAELAREFADSLEQRRALGRTEAERPVLHWSLSCAPEDRRLSAAELSVIAEEFVRRMGYEGCQYVAVEHNDRDHQHLHLVISRVLPDGSLIRDRLGDYHEAMRICRQFETEFGLRQVLPEQGQGLHQATRDEYREALRTEQPSERAQLQALVQSAAAGRPTLTEFVRRLEGDRVSVRLFRADDGPVLGISYRVGRFPFRGSALGSSLTWPGILRQVDYDPRRDRATVERISGRQPTAQRIPEDQAREVTDRVLAQRPTLTAFVATLKTQGITVRLNVARSGHVSGISYGLDGTFIKGSALGRDYSWHNLARRGLGYEPGRDQELVRSLSGGGGGGGEQPEPPALGTTNRRLALDEARRLTPEYQSQLLESAPDEAFVRDRGEIKPSPGLAGRVAVERIRQVTLARARGDFADEAPTPGLSLYPMAGYIDEDATPIADHLTYVDGYAALWRDDQGQVVGAAYVDGCLTTINVPAGLRQGFADYSTSVASPDRMAFMEWWAGHHHLLEGGDVAAIAVDSSFPRDTTRRAVREMWMDLGRHRVSVRLPYETDRSPTHLSLEGARSLDGQRADLVLSSAIAQAAVRNPDALLRVTVMPDSGRPLTRAELLRGVMDVVDGGGRQFHIEALAVKQAMRPLARDPEAFRGAFGFDLAVLPPQPILVLGTLPEGRHQLYFEDVFGRRLEEHNARVVEAQVGEGATGVRGAAREGVSGPAALGAREAAGATAAGHQGQDGPLATSPRPQASDADRDRLAQLIAQARSDHPTFTAFVARLQAAGVDARLYYLRDRPVSLAFVVSSPTAGRVFVKARELGPEYSWKRLRGELDFEPQRDAAAIAQVAHRLKGRAVGVGRRQPRATPEEIARVAALVKAARVGTPTFTDYVERLQAAGVDVRLYRLEGEPVALGYRARRPGVRWQGAWIRARALGPGNGWRRVLREGVNYDALRDAAAVASVAVDLPQRPSHRLQATADHRQRVREAVREALAAGATLTQFVDRVESRGIEVRLYRYPEGTVHSIGYGLPEAFVRGAELGPGHSWRSLLRQGLSFNPDRDAAALHRVGEIVQRREPARREARPLRTDHAAVREILRTSVTDRPTLTEFVERVESKGVEVRLYQDPDGHVHSIGFGLGRVSVNARELGETFTWQGLQARGLDYHPDRDRTTVDQVGYTLAHDDPRWRDVLDTARDIAHAARAAKRRLEQAAQFIEDPLSGLARAGSEAAMRAALRALAEALQAAGRGAAQRVAERQDDMLRERDRDLLAPARQGGDDRDPGPPSPPVPPAAPALPPLGRFTASPVPDQNKRSDHDAARPERPAPPPRTADRLGRGAELGHGDDASRSRPDAREAEGGHRSPHDDPGRDHGRPSPAGAHATGRTDDHRTEPAEPSRDGTAARIPGQRHARQPEQPDRAGNRHGDGRQAPTVGRGGEVQAAGPERDPMVPAGTTGGLAPAGTRDRGVVDSPGTERRFDGRPSREPADTASGTRPLTAAREGPTISAIPETSPGPAPDTTATPLQRLYASAKALRESIDEGVRASEQRLKDFSASAIARHAPVAAALLQGAPTPGRIKDLAEAPEKALIASGAAVVSRVVPAAAPILGTAANAVEKEIDRAREPDLDGRSR